MGLSQEIQDSLTDLRLSPTLLLGAMAIGIVVLGTDVGPVLQMILIIDSRYVEEPREDLVPKIEFSESNLAIRGTYFGYVVAELAKRFPIGRTLVLSKAIFNCNLWHRDPKPRLHISIITLVEAMCRSQGAANLCPEARAPPPGELDFALIFFRFSANINRKVDAVLIR